MPYILQVALILTGSLLFYKLLLQKETFYRINRFVLLLCLALAFALPLLPVPQQWSFRKAEPVVQEEEMPMLPHTIINESEAKVSPEVSKAQEPVVSPVTKISFAQVMKWGLWLYWFGVIAFAANFLLQLCLLLYRSYRNPNIQDGKFRIVEMSGDVAPCSFANIIFINPGKYEWDTYTQILEHEKIHVRQCHTLDILVAELVLILQWFNPFAWLYRRELESNLEFLADEQLLGGAQVEKENYQMSLLKVAAPHFPLSLTTNYNQSLLKKRIVMMNAKKSNVHTAWKYGFLLPLFVLFAALLNEPVAQDKSTSKYKENKNSNRNRNYKGHLPTEGYWFATIKEEKIAIQFKSDEDDSHSMNTSTFLLSEVGELPRNSAGIFNMTREAGTMEFSGKFEGNQGMGRYTFKADQAFKTYLDAEVKETLDESDMLVFFFVDVKKTYVQMLKKEGYTSLGKNDLIPMAALKIDEGFISSIKNSGFKEVGIHDLIPLKSLHIDGAYIKEIRDAGYPNISLQQLISFKAQNIDREYLDKINSAVPPSDKADKPSSKDPEDIVAFKALNVDDEYINSFKAVGLTNIDRHHFIAMKALGVTPAYVKSLQDMGCKDIQPEHLPGLKSQNITPEYIKSMEAAGVKNLDLHEFVGMKAVGVTPEYIKSLKDAGYNNIRSEDLTALKSQNITPEYIKSMEAAGIKNLDLHEFAGMKAVGVTPAYIKSLKDAGYNDIRSEDLTALKSQNITPEFIKGFESVGFKNIDLHDAIALKAVGVTPAYISTMKEKGFNYSSVQKYITLKTLD